MNLPRLGVVVVTFNASDVILDCLESLLAAPGVVLDIVVVDNASQDGTVALLKDWAAGTAPYTTPEDMPFALSACAKPVSLHAPGAGDSQATGHHVTLIETGANCGFAGGVNHGLKELAARAYLDRFWVLNPDSAVPPDTPRAFASHDPGPFSLMGGRVLYYHTPDMIQSDGGTLNTYTGVTGNLGLGDSNQTTPSPDLGDMDFMSGACMVASRAFYEAAGPMPEDYFLYYEEVEWGMKRGELPLAYCDAGVVHHRSGTAIGSPRLDRLASPFSIYFLYRARIRFVRRFFPASLPVAISYCCAKAAQLTLKGYRKEAQAVLQGCFNRPPPGYVTSVMSPEARKIAFPEHKNV